MNFASRMSRVTVSPTLKVSAEADRLRRQGVDVVDLGAGEPDFGTPEHVKDAAHAALNANFTKYTPSAGVLELRDAVCLRYRLDYGVEIRPEEVIITAGAKQALYNTAMGIIVAIPALMFYRHFRAKVDALVVEMEQQAIKLVDFAHGERRA